MNYRASMVLTAIVLSAVAAFAQADTSFQVRYASNLTVGDSVINITNTGSSSTKAFPTENGNLCVNVYTFSPDEQLVSCCACTVTPNALVSLSARTDLISNTLTAGVPTSVVVKLLASAGSENGTACNAATAGAGPNALFPAGPGGNPIVSGLAAWGTTIHALPMTPGRPPTTSAVFLVPSSLISPLQMTSGSPPTTYSVTETAFKPATLSPSELSRITTLCGFIQVDGSGFGICKSCRLGGLGGSPSAL